MSVENPSVLYVEQTLTAEQKERVCLNIGAQPTVAGKGLSSNDYTDAEKTKLSGIESGAEANVKPDWSAEAGSDAEILNKPSIPTVYDSTVTVKIGSTTVNTFTTNQSGESDIVIPEATESVTGAMTSTDKRKLNGIESGAQVNVKPDWNAASGTDAEILNKPTIPTVDQTYDGTSANAQSGVAVASAISEIDEVPTVGLNDNGKVLKASYSEGAGSYSWDTDSGEANVIEAITVNNETTTISSKTVNIPAATASTSGVGGTSGVMTPSDKEKLDGLVSNVQSDWNAASGSAAEILNKPTIPSVDQTYDSSSTNAQSGVAVASALSGIADVPAVGSSDNGKVLKATYSGDTGSYSWQPESGGGGGGSYMAGDGIDISAQDVISAKVDGTSITVNASHELTTSAEANVINGVKLDGAASVLTPDASKNVTIPNAVATGESGATNGLMTADDKKALGTAVQYVENPYEQSSPKNLIAQQMFVVESDQQIVDIVTQQTSLINGKGTLFFRITGI